MTTTDLLIAVFGLVFLGVLGAALLWRANDAAARQQRVLKRKRRQPGRRAER